MLLEVDDDTLVEVLLDYVDDEVADIADVLDVMQRHTEVDDEVGGFAHQLELHTHLKDDVDVNEYLY